LCTDSQPILITTPTPSGSPSPQPPIIPRYREVIPFPAEI
jgi:hypothetical protein